MHNFKVGDTVRLSDPIDAADVGMECVVVSIRANHFDNKVDLVEALVTKLGDGESSFWPRIGASVTGGAMWFELVESSGDKDYVVAIRNENYASGQRITMGEEGLRVLKILQNSTEGITPVWLTVVEVEE